MEPEGGVAVTVGVEHALWAEMAKLTTAPEGPCAGTIISEGHTIDGGLASITVNVAAKLFVAP